MKMNMDTCPVAELGRLMDEQFDAVADAERRRNAYDREAADAWVVALCLAQTAVQATSWRGVELQLIELSGAADGILSDPDVAAAIAVRGLFARQNAEKIRRLIGLIQEAVVALAPETAVDSHSDPAEAMLAA